MGTSVKLPRIFNLHLAAVIRNEIIKLPLINQSRQVIHVDSSLQCGLESRECDISGAKDLALTP